MTADAGPTSIDDSSVYSRLGMESRSILKSIMTEESKLLQSGSLARSDRHYFRARYNYYRLSLLRLPNDERGILEPYLSRFLSRIVELEQQTEDASREISPPPFLTAVERDRAMTSRPGANLHIQPPVPHPIAPPLQTQALPLLSPDIHQEAISQLSLVKLALQTDLTPAAKQILVEGIDRIIRQLQKNK